MQKINTILFIILNLPLWLSSQCVQGNCAEGFGIIIYQDYSTYIGRFDNFKANGYGTCYYSTGARYSGYWRDHEFHGEGTYIYPDGTKENGTWTNGTLTKAKEWIDSTANRQPNTWAMVVGVSNYRHLKPLNYPDDDAYRIMAFLQSPQGGAIQDGKINVLIDEAATHASIIFSLHEMVRQIGPNDKLIFYFSGHGFEDAFAPIDFDGQNNKLYHQEVINIIIGSLAKEKLCIVDACFTSDGLALKTSKPMDISNPYYQKFLDKQKKITCIFSTQANEASIEQKGLRQGIFSYFLLKGLKGEADTNSNKQVTIKEIGAYVQEQVAVYTNNYQRPIVLNFEEKESVISEIKD
jgi:hypothetical protein